MKLTILEAGRPPGVLGGIYPSYPEMFASLFSRAGEDIAWESLAVVDGAPLPDPRGLDAVLITGSPAGVYDPLSWIGPLRAFIRSAHKARTPMVGVCFGHQVIADALGGEVRKSEKGWGVGRHTYDMVGTTPWMTEAPTSLSLAASHQDQVITPPAGVRTLARSSHTKHALMVWDDAPILTLQGHPEFTDRFSAALYGARRGASLTDDQADAAIESLAQPDDNLLVASWMLRVLRG